MAYAEVKVEKKEARGRKKLHHIEIHPAKNGGHMVQHHYHHDMTYHEPEHHVFGPEQGEEMMAHVMKHAKVKMDNEEAEGLEPAQEETAEGE